VKIDYDHEKAVARKYKVVALPTIVFTDSYGNELFRYRGYVDARSLLELVNTLPGDVTELNRLNRILGADKANFEALEEMGKCLRGCGLFRASSDVYITAAQTPEAKSSPQRREAILNDIALNYLAVEDSRLSVRYFEKCLKEFPASLKRNEWTLNLGRAWAFGGKKEKEKARKILEALIHDHPSSPESSQAKALLLSL
jgi:hypothetical protein